MIRLRVSLKRKAYVMDEDESCSSSVEVTSSPVTPKEAWNGSWDDESHQEEEPDVVGMLPTNDWVVVKVSDICDTRFATGLEDHPTDVGPEETVMGPVWVQVGIGVTMVGTMAAGPPFDGTLYSSSTCQAECVLER